MTVNGLMLIVILFMAASVIIDFWDYFNPVSKKIRVFRLICNIFVIAFNIAILIICVEAVKLFAATNIVIWLIIMATSIAKLKRGK